MSDNQRNATQTPPEFASATVQGSQGGATIAPDAAVAQRGRNLTQAAVIRLGGRMAKIAASVIAFGLAARVLGGHTLGTFVTVFAFVQIFNTVANFGVDRILIRDLAQPERELGGHTAFTHATVTIRLLIAIGISGLCATAAVVVGFEPDQIVAILFFLPYIVISAFGTNGMYGSVLQARNDNNSIALASIVSAVVVVGGTVAVIFLHPTVNAFLAIYTISSLVDTAISAIASRRFVRWGMSWNGTQARYLLAESLPLAIGSAFVLVYGRIDIILLESIKGVDQAGLYGVAYKFYDVLSTVSATVMIVLFPGLARAYAESAESGKRLYTQVFTLMAAIALPISFAVIVFHPLLLTVLVGSGYETAAAALPGLMLAIALIFPSSVASYMLVVVRRQKWNLPMAVVASILNIGLNLLLIPRFGFVAAAWITAATEGFVIIFNLTVLAITTGMFPSPRKVIMILISAAPFALILLPGPLSYAGGAVGIVLFGVLLLLFGVVRPSQLRALVSSRPAANVLAEEAAEEEMEDVLPALAYVARSDQPSVQLAAIRSGRPRSRMWETSMHMKAIRPEDLAEPPRETKRRQIAGLFLGIMGLAAVCALLVIFVPAGVEIAALLVFAALLCLAAIRPQWGLFIFVLALPLHNLLMALLYHSTGDATFVKLIQPWKEVVLGIALLRAGLPALIGWFKTRRLRLTALDALILAFIALCLVSVVIPNHLVPLSGRVLGFRQLAFPFAAYFLGRLAPPSGREFRWLVGSFAVLALASAVGALGERLFWGGATLFTAVDFGKYTLDFFGSKFPLPFNMGYTFFTGTPNWLPRAGSITMNPLDLATLLCIALPIVLAALPFFKRYWGWPGRLLVSAAAVLGGAAVVVAFSRANLLAFPIELALVLLIIGFRRQWESMLLVGLGCAIGASLFAQTSSYVLDGEDPSQRVARALTGLAYSGQFSLLDIFVPAVTMAAMAVFVAALITATRAIIRRQRRLLATASMSAILALALASACLLTPPLAQANQTSVLAPLVPYAAISTNKHALDDSTSLDNTSTQGHVGSYRTMLPYMIRHPLGNGIGTAGFVGVRQGTSLSTESAYLPVGLQLGFPGLLLYLAIFLTILYAFWNGLRARLDRLTRAVFVGALAAWVFLMFDGLVTEVTLNFFVFYVMLWLAGAAVSLTRWTKVTWDEATQSYHAVRPLRVAMDAQCLHTARTGVRTYVTQLVEEFARSDMPHVVVAVSGPKGLPRTNVVFRMFDQALTLAWLHVFLPLRLAIGGFDVLFSPEYLTPIWCPIPCVVTYHDSAFLRRPQDYNRLWQLMFRLVNLPAVRRADAVVVPSDFARTEAIHYAKFSPDRVRVTPLGGPQPGSMQVGDEVAQQALSRFGLVSGGYILHVGVLERRKNLPMLVEAFGQLTSRGLPDAVKLVLVGQPGPRPDLNDAQTIRDTVERLGLQERVVLTGHLSREEVDALYTHAAVYALPSKSEGFGLPVLEAFAAGIPLVCSNAGALPEVAGDAALLFDPNDLSQLVESLSRLASDTALRGQLVEAGAERARMFTWTKTALETMEAFEAAVVHSCEPTNPYMYAALDEDASSVVTSAAR